MSTEKESKLTCFVPVGDEKAHRLALEFKEKAKGEGVQVYIRYGEPAASVAVPSIH